MISNEYFVRFVPFCGYNPNPETNPRILRPGRQDEDPVELFLEITGGDSLNHLVEEIHQVVKLISADGPEIDRARNQRHNYYSRNRFHRLISSRRLHEF